MTNNNVQAFFGVLGLAQKAGKLALGADICEETIRHGIAKIAFISDDTSDNTIKQISNACKTYGVELIKLTASKEALAKLLGKTGYVSCIVVKDEGFAKLIKSKLDTQTYNID